LPGKHGPNRLANYLNVHESWMADLLAEGFVVDDQSSFTFLPSVIRLQGPIICLDGITLEVDKEIAVLDGRGMTATVQTRWFRYQAWVRGVHNILRYDAAHAHRPHAHKHVYDTFGTGRELEVIELPDEKLIPTLGEVIRELQVWHHTNAARLHLLK
jgi:hypothetical protein